MGALEMMGDLRSIGTTEHDTLGLESPASNQNSFISQAQSRVRTWCAPAGGIRIMRYRILAATLIVSCGFIGLSNAGCTPGSEKILGETPGDTVDTGGSSADGSNGGPGGTAGSSDVLVDGIEFGGNAQSLKPYRETLTSDEAYHLLRRAAFGATPAQVDTAVNAGLTATVTSLMALQPLPGDIVALADSLKDNPDHYWLVYLIESPNPLYEHMAMFWHDRFATSRRILFDQDRELALTHLNMLRAYAMGNYHDFLLALTIDPMMLLWLDGANSPKEHPNENYAREFWELFTLGRDVIYTQQDIVESSRAFTGITLFRQQNQDARPIFDILHHDESAKSIFPDRASPANYDYRSVINLTLAQPEAARYVARNLFTFLVHDHPSDAVVQALADQFVGSGLQIDSLVHTLLMSRAFFSQDAVGHRITSPVEHMVGVARTLDMHIYSEDSQGYVLDQLTDDLKGAGLELLNPPDVSGWGDNEYWLQDQWVLSRVRALGRTMEYGPDHVEDLPMHLLPPQSEWSQREIRGRLVDAVAAAFHVHPTQEEKDIYIEVLDQDGWKAFHLEDPRYQPQQVKEMIRLVAMHEDVICQ